MSGLQVTYGELREQVGYHLGYGALPSSWDDDQAATVDLVIRGGLRRFMNSPLIPGTRTVWEWSFLRKNHLFSTAQGKKEYDLPADFGSPLGRLHYTSDWRTPVEFVNEAMIRAKESANSDVTGAPSHFAILHRPKPTVAPQGQTLLLFPEPDGAYELRMLYQVSPEMLSESLSNPHGGAPHARTILFACLAEAGTRVDADKDYEAEYQMSLMASIDYDRRQKGDTGGYSRDMSDERPEWPRANNYVTYNGVLYEG